MFVSALVHTQRTHAVSTNARLRWEYPGRSLRGNNDEHNDAVAVGLPTCNTRFIIK
jgi:hypothetical protein